MLKTHRAYLAGLIDGEGCFSTYGNYEGKRYVEFSMTQKNGVLLETMQEWVGGYGYIHTSRGYPTWKIRNSVEIRALIREIYPYLILKRPQAKLAYAMTKMHWTKRLYFAPSLSQMKRVYNTL